MVVILMEMDIQRSIIEIYQKSKYFFRLHETVSVCAWWWNYDQIDVDEANEMILTFSSKIFRKQFTAGDKSYLILAEFEHQKRFFWKLKNSHLFSRKCFLRSFSIKQKNIFFKNEAYEPISSFFDLMFSNSPALK